MSVSAELPEHEHDDTCGGAEGEPEMKNAQWFEDVAKGQWYSDAVSWATFNGITMGYGDGNFGPDDNITREQIATIMHRFIEANK